MRQEPYNVSDIQDEHANHEGHMLSFKIIF